MQNVAYAQRGRHADADVEERDGDGRELEYGYDGAGRVTDRQQLQRDDELHLTEWGVQHPNERQRDFADLYSWNQQRWLTQISEGRNDGVAQYDIEYDGGDNRRNINGVTELIARWFRTPGDDLYRSRARRDWNRLYTRATDTTSQKHTSYGGSTFASYDD